MRARRTCVFLGWVGVTLAALAACGGGGGGPDDINSYDSIEIDPPQATVTVPLGGTVTKTYAVYGVKGARRTDVTALCTLAVDPTFGTVAGADLTVLAHGGHTYVTAACDTRSASADLTVNLTGIVVVGTGTPPDAPTLFGNATLGSDGARTPALEYPIDRAVSPVNIPSIETQWTAAGNDLFHLRLTSTYVAVDVYTSDPQATLGAADWDAVATSAAGGDLTFAVEGLAQASPDTRFAGTPRAVVMSHDSIDKTAIYYWASSQGNIMSQTFGSPNPPALVKNGCTSCHSLSRAGTRLGYSRCVGNDCGQLYAGFLRYDAPSSSWVEAINANDKAIHGSYTTFAPVGNPFPTDAQALAIVSMANGTLALYDPDTGQPVTSNLTDVASHGPSAPRAALMADWSADGSSVVFASTPHPGQWIDLSDGAIATTSYSYQGGAHVFGEPQFLVSQPISLPGGTYSSFFFPSYSNDGKLVVFDAARGAWRNFSNAASAGQRLMLADAGGAWIKDLTALNGGNVDSDITWPHWAPGESSDYYWIVFSSERDYGHEVTAGNTAPACVANGVRQCKQIWIGAVSKGAIAAGQVDPSAPPMWLPGQDARTDNISPFWTAGVIVN